MIIESIFAYSSNVSPDSNWAIWALVDEDKGENEISLFATQWLDNEFIKKSIEDLRGLKGNYLPAVEWGSRLTIDIKDEAIQLRQLILPSYLINELGAFKDKRAAERHLRRLHQKFVPIESYPKPNDSRMKAWAHLEGKKGFLRVYSLFLRPNIFIITGSGFKATNRMEDDPKLKEQLNRLKKLQTLIEDSGLNEAPMHFFESNSIKLKNP